MFDKLKTLESANYDELTHSNNNFKPHFEDMISLYSKSDIYKLKV